MEDNNTNKTNGQDSVPEQTGSKYEIVRDELGRFVEGICPNPSGRPKGSISITTYLKQVLEEELEVAGRDGIKTKKQTAEVIARRIIQEASKGDAVMTKLLMSYVDGLPEQSMKLSGNVGVSLSKLFDESKKDDRSRTV